MHTAQWWALKVPARLLTDRRLRPVSRQLYMVLLELREPGTDVCKISERELLEYSQLGSRMTLRKHLEQLERTDWIQTTKGRGRHASQIHLRAANARGPVIRISGSLILHAHLTPTAKWLYCFLTVCTRNAAGPRAISQVDLRQEAGLGDDRALRAAVRQLLATGWLHIHRARGLGGSVYEPLDPHFTARLAAREQLDMYLQPLQYKGEALLKEMLNVLVADDRYEDNARPGFLVNPATGEKMEFDRWYPDAKVAIEFNGPQHYATTKKFSDAQQVLLQQQRDLTKAALAGINGTTIVTITPAELTFARLQTELADRLPLRKLHMEDPIVKFLDSYSRSYASKARRGHFTA